MTLSLELMTDTLPVGFAELEADAKTDGHGHLTRLAAEFGQSPAIFHAIFACHLDRRLAGIGTITEEPGLTSQPTWRMRRLYVRRKFRRRKVARAIANAHCEKQRRTFPLLRYMQEMKARPGFGRQLDSARLPVAPGLTKQQRLAQLLGCEVHK
jgi:GNAT superfamily N-acetyltransferase